MENEKDTGVYRNLFRDSLNPKPFRAGKVSCTRRVARFCVRGMQASEFEG